MSNIRNRLWVGAALTALTLSAAYAATQGTTGSTSTGTIQINASKAAAVRISGLADITFPATASPPSPVDQTACLYSTTGSYTIQATSNNGQGGAFRLKGSGETYIRYLADWFNDATAGTDSSLNSGSASGPITGANTTSDTCGGSNNSRIRISIDSGSFISAAPGTYSDTLTLLVSPV